MLSGSSSAAGWSTRLELPEPPADLQCRPDDPRLGEVMEFWHGDEDALEPGRAVLLGFPQDEGVRRNHGRPGAAEAPRQIRHWLHRLTPWDGCANIGLTAHPPLDLGNLRIQGTLEESQEALGEVVGAILERRAVPIVLGGGHETAYGHYLGYVQAGRRVGIINLDAHLDLRPCQGGQGHSGTSFRQALEHPAQPLPGPRYVCMGAQPQSVSREHLAYAREKGCVVCWQAEVEPLLRTHFMREQYQLAEQECQVYVSLDADVVRAGDVPGVSAPNAGGLAGQGIFDCLRLAGMTPEVASLDLVEINPRFDCDGQSARWAAVAVWHFLIGLAARQLPRIATNT